MCPIKGMKQFTGGEIGGLWLAELNLPLLLWARPSAAINTIHGDGGLLSNVSPGYHLAEMSLRRNSEEVQSFVSE